MKSKKHLLVIVILVLFSTVFCSLFQSQPPETPDAAQEAGKDEIGAATSTPAPTPTLAPTNLVKLEDDGAPLPPQIMQTSPIGGQEMGANGTITIQFDQSMDQNTTSAAFQLTGPLGEAIAGDITWPNNTTLQFNPAAALTPGETYQAQVAETAASAQNLNLPDPYAFDIYIASDLIISQVFPADGAAEIESDAAITVIFNRPVVPLTTAEDQTNLPQPVSFSPPISGRGEWLNTSVYVFRPTEALASATTYTAQVAAGLHDTINTQLQDEFNWQFTTAAPTIASYGIEAPISAYNPDDNYTDVRPNASFMISFFQPMNQSSVEEAFSLYTQQGDDIRVDFEWVADSQVIISPTQALALATDYTLMLTTNARSESGGNLAEGLRWTFSTLPYPYITGTYPEDGSTQDSFSSRLGIYFSSPMRIENLEDYIVFTPKLDEEASWNYNPWGWSVDFFGLAPSTDYRVQILPGLQDIYGNEIAAETTIRFRTADYRPAAFLDLPYAPAIYRADGPMKYYLTYVNVETVNVNLYQIPAAYFAGFTNGSYSRWDFTPPEEWWVNAWEWVNEKDTNEVSHVGIGLKDALRNSIEPGFYFLTINSPQIESYGPFLDTRLIIVADANLTFKTTQTEALMWLTDLDSGAPIEGASLIVFDYNFAQIGTGATNANGLLQLDLPVPENAWDSRYVMTAEGEPFAFAISDWSSGVSPYDFGLWSNYYVEPDQSLAYVYTDRPLYRPGQPVSFKGILRHNDDLNYSLLPWENVEVEISSYNETIYKETLPVSEFGTFNGEITLADNAALGYYSIIVRHTEIEDSIGGVSFSVAEYRKPEFQISTTAEPQNVLSGEDFQIQLAAEYYAGGGVGNADVNWAMNASNYFFEPAAEYRRYNFNDYDRDTGFYDIYDPPRDNLIANGVGQTDENGRFEQTLTADLTEAGQSRQFTFEATVSDVAGTAVSGRVTVIGHKAAVYPGVRSQRYVGVVAESQSFDLVVLNWDSEPVPGSAVDVEIVERRWNSIQKQDPQGYITWETAVEEIPAASFTNVEMDAQGRSTVSFTPEKGGVYKAIVTATDEYGNQAQSGAYIWVSSSTYVSWRQSDDRQMELIADKDSYQPGDIAEILIASPLQGSNYALITTERGHIRTSEVMRLTSNSAVYRLPITADMAPNIYVSVLVIQGADVADKPDFRLGMIELAVSTEQQAIQVEITPDKAQAGPGDEVTYTIRTRDHNGQPVSAEVSLALADLATLALMDPNSQPILDYFYDQRALSVQTAVPIVLSIEHYIVALEDRLTLGEGMGSGGGGKGADVFGVFEIRGDFKDTAYWEAQVVTDANGEATVRVTLPDNLTTWHMDARAVTVNTMVGDAENEIRSTKPLLVRPQTPRFFVVGDEATLGAAVHNNSDQDLSVTVSLQAEGLTLKSDASQQVELAAGNQTYVTWEVIILPEVERVDLVFAAEGGPYSDASRPTVGTTLTDQGIPVYRYEAPETVGTAGILSDAGSKTEGISIPSSWDVTQGDLTVRIAPSLAAGLTEGLDYLAHYPYECVEQTISRFLPNVLTTQALQTAGLSDPTLENELKEQVNIGLQRLYNWQRADGGWGWWPESQASDPQTSAYVVMGLVEAQNAGYHVSADALTRGKNYLKSQLMSLGSLDQQYLLNRQAFILYVLARAGEPQISQTVVLFDARQNLSIYARAYLAETLWRIDPADPRIATLLSDIQNAAVLSATGTYWQENWRDYWNWNTDTRTTATVLGTLILIDPENPLTANAVRWLMSSRYDGHWATTQETAWTLMSLTEWMLATQELEANYDWAVGLNGTRLGDGSANAETIKITRELKADISQIFMDEVNRLVIGRDKGTGNLYYTAHLNVYLPVDQIQPLDRGIIVSREYFDPNAVGENVTVSTAQQGDLMLARLTVIVPNDLHYVVIDDPLPAGLEAVDQTLETNPDITAPSRYDYESMWRGGWGWWYFDHVELRDERVVISADYLPAGTYVYTYIVRASTPGAYHVIPPTAQAFYFPEIYGRGAGSMFIVEP